MISGIDDSLANRDRDRMRPVDGAELARSGCKMLFRGALRDVQDFADLPGGLALRRPGDYLALARREACRRMRGRSEQTADVVEAVHRDQVQCRLAAGIEIEMDATERDAGLIAGQAMDRHDETARHPEIGSAPHHLHRTRLELSVVRRLRPFERIHRVPALADHGIDAVVALFGIEAEPL